MPSATTEAGLAAAVDTVAFTGPGVKVTCCVWVIVMLSVASFAAYVIVSAFVSLTVKVATPLAFVVALAGEIVELPVPWVRVTVLPLTGWLRESNKVTVIDKRWPSRRR